MHSTLKTLLFILIISQDLFGQSFPVNPVLLPSNFNFIVEHQSTSGIIVDFLIEESFIEYIVKNKNSGLLKVQRFLAVPKGATASIEIIWAGRKSYQSINYSNNYMGTNDLVKLSTSTKIRGVDAVLLEINPCQYDLELKKMVVYNELKLQITFNGGNGYIGAKRLRNRWWDQIFEYLFLNYESLPKINYTFSPDSINEGFEYVIITPDNPVYLSWADSLKNFRTLQGIKTGIVTLSEIGGNDVTLIENFIDDAYNSWVIPPVAILFLADYGNGSATGNGITSPIYDNYCVSDNIYADVDEDHLPDIIISRITAQNSADLESIVGKILNYERTPPSFPDFYNNPLCVSGWPFSGTSVLCAEVIFGFYENELGKQPNRQYSGYSGGAPPAWPTDPYSNSLIQLFGPNGLGYVPATPSHLTNWTGSAAGINQAINNGTFSVYYRGQGSEISWGEPVYSISDLSGLNSFYPPFIASIVSLTGKFNYSNDCLAESLLEHPNGALGIIAATEVTYSIVTSDYGWGLYDYMWPHFLPGELSSNLYQGVLPAFANVAAKYFLQQNNSPYYNQQAKEVTYYLFHYFGDAFSKVYTELPQSLFVSHDSILIPGDTIFTVATNENALICLTVNGEIIAVETCTGLPQDIIIPPQSAGDTMLVTVTKQNYYRYSRSVPVQQPTGIDETEKLIVEKFALFQNHPNPFNQTTIIQYSLKERSLVELVLFDVLGRRVEDLVVEEQDAGYYEVNFNAPKLSSGIYFYTVKAVPTGRQAGDPSTGSGQSFLETKKMVLMK